MWAKFGHHLVLLPRGYFILQPLLTVYAVSSRLRSMCYSAERKKRPQLIDQLLMGGASQRGDQSLVGQPVWQAERHHHGQKIR